MERISGAISDCGLHLTPIVLILLFAVAAISGVFAFLIYTISRSDISEGDRCNAWNSLSGLVAFVIGVISTVMAFYIKQQKK